MDRWGEKSNLDGPLEFGGKVIGVLGIVESRYCRRFSEPEKQLFAQLSVLAAIAIHNADVFAVLEHLVITDGLTDLYNHRYFYERLAQEVARAQRYDLLLSLLMIDIDDFKSYNDRFGHRAGDAVLRDLGARLKTQTRQQIDLVARYGGEEFAIILPSTGLHGAAAAGERLRSTIAEDGWQPGEDRPSDEDRPPVPGEQFDTGAALTVAERIRSSIAGEVFGAPDSQASITVSVGVATYPVHAASGDSLVDAADQAVYRAKALGRNRVETASEPAPE
jgi:diguanylate cyclase (GGDEF)-like protein